MNTSLDKFDGVVIEMSSNSNSLTYRAADRETMKASYFCIRTLPPSWSEWEVVAQCNAPLCSTGKVVQSRKCIDHITGNQVENCLFPGDLIRKGATDTAEVDCFNGTSAECSKSNFQRSIMNEYINSNHYFKWPHISGRISNEQCSHC